MTLAADLALLNEIWHRTFGRVKCNSHRTCVVCARTDWPLASWVTPDLADAIQSDAGLTARLEGQCPVTQEAPDLRPDGAPFAPSTYYCVLRLGHVGAHQFRDAAL